MQFKDLLACKARQAKLELSETQLHLFSLYYERLLETNRKINLTAITQPEEVAVKHFLDSLSVYEEGVFFPGAHICDVGTGAGFPGLPLKIYRPDLQVVLLDSLNKRLKFLNALLQELALSKGIETAHLRAEDAGNKEEYREKFDVVVARAVAPLNILAEYSLPLVKVGGIFAALKAKQGHAEMIQAKKALQLLGAKVEKVKQVFLPGLEDERVIIYLKKIKTTPPIYPRRAGLPEKQPL